MHKLYNYKNAFRILKGGKISLVVSAFLTTATLVHASPTGGNVTSGNATISQNGNTTNINQFTNKASINWQNFNVGSNETVNFNQPNSNSVTLNKVTGTTNSMIQGALNANGQVILINPNGVVFSEGSTVNVGGLVATTKNISEQDFQNGNYKFEGDSNASILNKGTINAKYVAMMGKTVQNEGTITATLGKVELAGGNKFTLNLNGDSLLKLTIDEGTLNALVENKGIIKADGGVVHLTTQALNSILDGVVNNTGIIEAQSLNTNQNGEIVLYAHSGTANIGGTIKAEGGFVETSGKEFKIKEKAVVKAKEWLIDPVNITIDSTLAGTISTALGSGDVTITTSGSCTGVTCSGTGSDGDIFVNSAISWASDKDLTLHADRNININADITATNASGKLTLEYGQRGGPNADLDDYNIASGVKINLQNGQNFTTKHANATAVDYTVVNSVTDLQSMSLTGNTALGSNLDLGSINWTPIGNPTTNFSGKFDGLGHTLNHLTYNGSGDYIGLFGITNTGTLIRDIGLENVNITSTTTNIGQIGALVGCMNDATTIENVYATGQISGLTTIGGLVGYGYYATIKNSYSSVNVTGTNENEGGLLGFSYYGNINNSYASGNIRGRTYVGGLIGGSEGDTLNNVYALGKVTSTGNNSKAGGLIGRIAIYSSDDISTETINNVYSTGTVTSTGTGSSLGGLFGSISNSGGTLSVSNAYWDSTTTGQTHSTGANVDTTGTSAITNANAYTQANYSGFDFTNDWFMVDGSTRPFLRMEWTPVISNAHQLQMMGSKLGTGNIYSYTLANNINLATSLTNKSEMWKDNSASVDYANYKGSWLPIGTYTSGSDSSKNFMGQFDGQNYTISNLYIYMNPSLYASSYIGLFGYTNGARLSNLTLSNANLTGYRALGILTGASKNTQISNITVSDGTLNGGTKLGGLTGEDNGSTINNITVSNIAITSTEDSAGGIIGFANGTTLQNSSTSGTITATDGYAGGLIGEANNATISNTYSTASIGGGSSIGGLVGQANSTTISNSHATGNVTSADSNYYVGGLVGYVYYGSLDNVYATGNVIAGNNAQYIGGLVGYFYGDGSGTIHNSFSTGAVSSGTNSTYVGGLIGDLYTTNIDSVYATGNVTTGTGSEDVGGLIGNMEYGELHKSFATGNVTGTTSVGGLIGYTDSVDKINDNYATGSVTGTTYVGGLIGDAYYRVYEIQRNYASGSVTGTTAVGGFAGRTRDGWTSIASNNFWDATTTGQTVAFNSGFSGTTQILSTAGKVSSDTTDMLKKLSNYSSANWDIVTDSSLSNVYPQLRWATTGLAAGSSVWVIGKAPLTYSLANASKTYGQTYTLPTPTFTGGTPTATPTVKVYDANNVDVTSQAIAGTLAVGTYTVKTTLSDTNYNLSSSGNTTGTLTINPVVVGYSVDGGAKTYGQSFTLPTPTFVGGTPANGSEVKVYSGSTDVTSQAIAGTLPVGSYTVKVVNYLDSNRVASSELFNGVLTVGKADVNYSVNNSSKTYGQTYILPAPTFTGGTPTGTTTVKVYDANNVDVTAQAIAGTLATGTYIVKTLLTDTNYDIASSGNTIGTLVIGKKDLNYSLANSSKTYGQTYTLPTPTFTGGTPTGTATVKVYDVNSVDVTAQALEGTLPVGTYSVKTLLTDGNYQIASNGNSDGILTIVAAPSTTPTVTPTTPSNNTVAEQEKVQQEKKVNDIITSIVNNTVKSSVVVNNPILPIKTDTVNVFDKKVSSSIVNKTVSLDNSKSLGSSALGLNEVIRTVKPDVNTVSKDTKLTVVGETGGEAKITTVELQDLVAKSGGGELRVALSPDSFVELVNGGVTLPKGVSQEFYVVEDKK